MPADHAANKNNNKTSLLTVSGPTTLVGGGIWRSGFLNSGPGLLRDKRLRIAVCDAKLPANPFPVGLAAKSKPCNEQTNKKKTIEIIEWH